MPDKEILDIKNPEQQSEDIIRNLLELISSGTEENLKEASNIFLSLKDQTELRSFLINSPVLPEIKKALQIFRNSEDQSSSVLEISNSKNKISKILRSTYTSEFKTRLENSENNPSGTKEFVMGAVKNFKETLSFLDLEKILCVIDLIDSTELDKYPEIYTLSDSIKKLVDKCVDSNNEKYLYDPRLWKLMNFTMYSFRNKEKDINTQEIIFKVNEDRKKTYLTILYQEIMNYSNRSRNFIGRQDNLVYSLIPEGTLIGGSEDVSSETFLRNIINLRNFGTFFVGGKIEPDRMYEVKAISSIFEKFGIKNREEIEKVISRLNTITIMPLLKKYLNEHISKTESVGYDEIFSKFIESGVVLDKLLTEGIVDLKTGEIKDQERFEIIFNKYNS